MLTVVALSTKQSPPPPLPVILLIPKMASLSVPEHPHRSRWHFGDLDDDDFDVSGRCILVVTAVSSFLILLLILCLYIWWALRYRHVAVTAEAEQEGAAAAAGCHGLSREAIDSIPVRDHVAPAAGDEEAQCSICLSALEEGERLKVLPGCNHGFHLECVDAWLSARATCPLCRASLEGCCCMEKHEEEESSPV